MEFAAVFFGLIGLIVTGMVTVEAALQFTNRELAWFLIPTLLFIALIAWGATHA